MGVKAGRQAVNDASKATVNAVLNGWIAIFGAPNIIFCDPDSRFCGNVFMRFLKEVKVTPITSPSKHHESIGAVERKHQVLHTAITDIMKDKQAK